MGQAVMALDEAIRTLDRQHSVARLGPDYVRHARAAATVVDHAMANRHELRPVHFTTDRWRIVDGGPVGQFVGDEEPTPENGITPGAHADGPVGSELVMKLPGDVSAYFIAADGDGNACLYRSIEANGQADPGQVSDSVRDWFQHQADTTRTRLRAMNTANAAFWQKRQA